MWLWFLWLVSSAWRTGSLLRCICNCCTGSASACATWPCAIEIVPMLNLRPHDLREQALYLALREVKLARQRAYQRQGAWAELATGHTRGQRRVVLVPAATADTAQAQVLRHLRCDRRQIKDLAANRLVVTFVHHHIALAQRTWRLGPAVGACRTWGVDKRESSAGPGDAPSTLNLGGKG